MPRLTAAQIRQLNILSAEPDAEDTGSESEIDQVDFSDSDSEDKDIDAGLDNNSHILAEDLTSISESRIPDSVLSNQADNRINFNKNIYGRVNKKNPNPFEWFEKPNETFDKIPFQHASVIPRLKDETSIECFFKFILSIEIVNKIAKFNALKISKIKYDTIENENNRQQKERLLRTSVSTDEIYGFIFMIIQDVISYGEWGAPMSSSNC